MAHKPVFMKILFHDESPDSIVDLGEIRWEYLYVSKLQRGHP